MAYARTAKPRRGVFLVHGEPDQQEPLRETLCAEGMSVTVPSRTESAEL